MKPLSGTAKWAIRQLLGKEIGELILDLHEAVRLQDGAKALVILNRLEEVARRRK